MERTMVVVWLMIIGHLVPFSLNFVSFAQQTTMCISQFALANQACAVLPSEQALRGANRTKSQDDGDSDDYHEDDNDDVDGGNYDYGDDNDEGDVDEHGRRRSHGNEKRGRRKRRQKHGRKHGGGGGGQEDEPRANKDCCRWLEELDESCVCDALLRLPPFLVKPSHKYSIKVGKSCKFSYDCYGV